MFVSGASNWQLYLNEKSSVLLFIQLDCYHLTVLGSLVPVFWDVMLCRWM